MLCEFLKKKNVQNIQLAFYDTETVLWTPFVQLFILSLSLSSDFVFHTARARKKYGLKIGKCESKNVTLAGCLKVNALAETAFSFL